MGVRNFDFVPWTWTASDELAGVIAVDVPNYLTRRLSVLRPYSRRDSERVPFTHISVALSLIRATLSSSILPILVFDGPPESLKRPCNPALLQRARALYNRLKRDGDPYDEETVQNLSNSPALYSYFAQFHIADLAQSLGIPTVSAPSEAEMYAAVLSRDSVVTSVVSNDMDTLLFGAQHVTKQLVLSRGEILRTTQSAVLHATGLTLSQLRDLAIICGCDFHDGVKGIGPRKGITLLLRHGNLDGVLRARGYSHKEREEFSLARETFDEADLLHPDHSPPRLNPPLVSGLERVLKPVFDEERREQIAESSVRLWKEFGFQQSTLESWI